MTIDSYSTFNIKIKPGVPTASKPSSGGPSIPGQVAPPEPVVIRPVVTKKEIILDKKVKGVTWNRLLLMPKEAPNRVATVWDNISEIKVDIDEVASMFEIKSAAPVNSKEDSNKPVQIKKKKFLNDKRTQSVGIGLAKCPPIDKIELALKNMNIDILPKQQVFNLSREYITEEEILTYESLNSLPGDWEKEEDRLIRLKNIDFSKEKLQVWSFFLEIEDHLENLELQVSLYKSSFESIRTSDTLKRIFSYILTYGNILNGGTPKGQADGFNLDILNKLTSLKDNSNKTFLQIICLKIKNDTENLVPLKKSFESLEECLKIPSNETKTSIDKYLKQAESNKTVLEKINIKDEFCQKAEKKMDEILNFFKKLEDGFKKNFENAQKTVEFFGYTKSDAKFKKPDEFLQLISDFLGDFDKSIPVTEAKKAFKGAAEMGKKITDNKNPALDSLMNGLKMKLGNNN